MSSSIIFFILFSLTLLFSITEANLDRTCNAMANSNFTINYDFCISSLKSDPNSLTADAHELALIIAKLSMANATKTKSKIDVLIQEHFDPMVKTILKMCSASYSNLIQYLVSSINAFEAGEVVDAVTKLDFAKGRPFDCEDLFFEAGKKSPVDKEDNDLVDLVTLALAITISLV